MQLLGLEVAGSAGLVACMSTGAILSATDSVAALQIMNPETMPLLYSLVFGEVMPAAAPGCMHVMPSRQREMSISSAGHCMAFTGMESSVCFQGISTAHHPKGWGLVATPIARPWFRAAVPGVGGFWLPFRGSRRVALFRWPALHPV
jgi:hypothetical protein